MPVSLRLALIVFSVLFLLLVFSAVNKKRLQMNYSLVWIFVSLGMMLVAGVPGVLTWILPVLGVELASNLIFLLALIVLLTLSFSLTLIVSKQTARIRRLVQVFAIAEFLREHTPD